MPVRYSFADLAELSSAIGKAHSSVDTLKGDITSSAGQLAAAWEGSATESWQTVQQKWTGACDQLLTALHQLSVTVQCNADEMAATEAKNAGLFSGM